MSKVVHSFRVLREIQDERHTTAHGQAVPRWFRDWHETIRSQYKKWHNHKLRRSTQSENLPAVVVEIGFYAYSTIQRSDLGVPNFARHPRVAKPPSSIVLAPRRHQYLVSRI